LLTETNSGLVINRLFAEVLCQHVIDNGTVFVALGLAVHFDHFVDRFHQVWTVWQAQLFDEEVVFNRFKLGWLPATLEASAL
jgi:hypothetical protein